MIGWSTRLERAIRDAVCVRCGDPATEGVCAACVDTAMVKQEVRRDELQAAGMCRCGQPARPGARQCEACLTWDRNRQRWKERAPELRATEDALVARRRGG